jgi:tetratricopeptide (TPR) repeat protein
MPQKFLTMKRLAVIFIFSLALGINAQTKKELVSHFRAYYKQMRLQGDARGVIDALTHLNILAPNKAQKDTLAYLYANSSQYLQAINVLGAEKNTSDSDLALQVKAVSLKSLNQPQLAVQHYELLYQRSPNTFIAYELADLNLQIGKVAEAETHIKYGLANAKEEDMLPFYESNPPYQIPIKAAFIYLNGLFHYNKDKTNIDAAIKYLDEAITIAPNFTLAKQIREALLNQKQQGATKKQ